MELLLVQILKRQLVVSHKLSISYKEARETVYWLKLLKATDYLNQDEANSLIQDAEELCKILSSILISTKQKINKKIN